jgi:hypothetical protein
MRHRRIVQPQGERIYHMPGGLDYAKVNMAAPGKRGFSSEEDAETAGWRPAKRYNRGGRSMVGY